MTAQANDYESGQRRIVHLFGPFLIGIFLNMILYGVLSVQVLTYFQTYRKDRWVIKALVSYLFTILTLNTGLDMYLVYKPLVEQYGTNPAHVSLPVLLACEPIIIGLVATPVQFFIAYRIKMITESVWIPAVICFLSSISMAASFWTSAMLVRRVGQFDPRMRGAILLWSLTAAVTDIILMGTLIYALYRKKKGSFKAMESVLNKIILLTVQTGMITALAAVLDVTFYFALPHTTINLLCGFASSKLYANFILSTFNARSGWNNTLYAGNDTINLLWENEGEILDKRSSVRTNSNGIIVFAKPTTTSNFETTLGVSVLSHRSRAYETEMDLLPSRVDQDDDHSFAAGDSLNIRVDNSADALVVSQVP